MRRSFRGKGRGGTSRRARPDALRSPQRPGVDSRTRIRVAGGRARVPPRDRAQPEQCPGASGARGLGSRRAGTFRRGPSGGPSRGGSGSAVAVRQYGSRRGALLAGRYGEAVDQLRKASCTGSKPEQTVQPARPRPHAAGEDRRGTEAFDEAIKRGAASLRSGGRVPKCARDDATRRSVSCKSNPAPPGHRGIWRGPMRASAMRSTRSNIWRSRFDENEPGLAGALQAPELRRDAHEPAFRALRKKVNLAP